MQQQDKDRVSYYAALTIFFSFIELFIPKPLPFFRLGIANVPILLSLNLPLPAFSLLLFLKGIGSSYISGNLFSIFAIVSLAQTFASGYLMFLLKVALGKHISNYGLSMAGALISTYVQIELASLYIGQSITKLSGVMLLISLISSLFVAFMAGRLNLPETAPSLEWNNGKYTGYVEIITLLFSAMAIMMIKTPFFAAMTFVLALIEQKILGRKIRIVPHIMILITMIFTSLLTPSGRIIFSIGSWPITIGSIKTGIEKAFVLSSSVALSQGYSMLIRPNKGIIGKTLAYYTSLISAFKENGNMPILDRIKQSLSIKTLTAREKGKVNIRPLALCLFTIAFIGILLLSRIYPSQHY